MFNYYQHRASPDDEASDVTEEEFVHLVWVFLGWGLASVKKLAELGVFKGRHIHLSGITHLGWAGHSHFAKGCFDIATLGGVILKNF